MAISLTTLRNQIVTSIHGRRFGLDKNGYIMGQLGQRLPLVAATSDTTATALPASGMVTVTTTTNDGWTLTDPVSPSQEVVIMTGSSSTGTHTVTCAAATITSSTSGAVTAFAMAAGNTAITLFSVSTAAWLVRGMHGSITLTS